MTVLFRSFSVFILLCLLAIPALVHAQNNPSRIELEQRKKQLQQEIEEASQALTETQKSKKQTLSQVRLLQNKIALRTRLIENINQEINFINGDINAAYHDVRTLQRDLDTLKQQYSQLVVYAYKNRSAYDFLNFIFSARNFNDAIRRFQYLKQYRAYRQQQADNIVQTQALLKKKIELLSQQKVKKAQVLSSEQKQRLTLQEERKQKDAIVAQLRGSEKELLKQINEKKKQQQRLNAAIAALIRREIEEARRKEEAAAKVRAEEARKKALAEANASKTVTNATTAPAKTAEPAVKTVAPAKPANVFLATPEGAALSANFESNRGNLPWPVARGMISDEFGIHQHPVFEHIQTQNDGVTIRTDRGANVRAVFDGEVTTFFQLPGTDTWVITIRHGQYLTVYGNIDKPLVSRGEKVKTKQNIGIVADNAEGDAGELQFQIWKGMTPINPSSWIKR